MSDRDQAKEWRIHSRLEEDDSLRHALGVLRRQHHALRPIYALDIPVGRELIQPVAQQYLVEQILRDPLIKDHEPTRQYERGFWKKVLGELEDGLAEWRSSCANESLLDQLEVDNAFSEAVAGAMITDKVAFCSTADIPSQSYRTFIYDRPTWNGLSGEAAVTLLEEQVAIQAGTTGLRTWTAALHLGHLIVSDPICLSPRSDFSDRFSLPQIIELGAGTGFLSILLAQLSAEVIATDIELSAAGSSKRLSPLTRLRHNIELNKLGGCCTTLHLDWTDSLRYPANTMRRQAFGDRQDGREKVILAADCIYDPELVPAFVATLKALLACDSSERAASFALIASAVRNEATMQVFTEQCTANNLRIEDIARDPMSGPRPTFWDGGLDSQCTVVVLRVTK